MCTVITRIEAIVNTRPLTKLNSSDITEIPLRPVDFLRGNLSFSLPNEEIIATSDDTAYDPDLIQTEKQTFGFHRQSPGRGPRDDFGANCSKI
ncbi:hypothetical protein Y032_0221g2540 [Ancylostoma ceylanicum]|uniref:Uncharacterized protein n=1 Tax=Ancylostoma ceylanicum TaxID=53326 RepID=A0A016SIY5_9BILA|nr:hypothetical protein Y032_0221g2540 [Ancylostoma ceylanicum]